MSEMLRAETAARKAEMIEGEYLGVESLERREDMLIRREGAEGVEWRRRRGRSWRERERGAW